MDAKSALKVIKEVGIYNLASFDLCLCGNFRIKGVDIDIACWKGSGAVIARKVRPEFVGLVVRVYNRCLDSDGEGLSEIAKEVSRQLNEKGHAYQIMARFCDWQDDSEQRCTYCHKPRADPIAYLCEECQNSDKPGIYVGHTVADDLDYRKFDFVINPQRCPDHPGT